MKNIVLGLVAAFALVSFAAPVHAEEAGGEAAKTEAAPKKKAKKAKKAAEGEEAKTEAK